jgi:fructose-1,6-bisphosphatase/sedoheptulose 1,7-bisphosphatase-like protein
MTNTEIVKKIIGDIQPSGDSRTDIERFENLKAMCKLVDDLVTEIDHVTVYKSRHEHSMNEMGNYASKFLTKTLGIVE